MTNKDINKNLKILVPNSPRFTIKIYRKIQINASSLVKVAYNTIKKLSYMKIIYEILNVFFFNVMYTPLSNNDIFIVFFYNFLLD